MLEFIREDDRWQHAWSCRIGDRCVRLMTSVEGSSEQTFPSSPPIQEIHDHPTKLVDGSDGGAILGVGMAGKGHWSVSHSIEQTKKPDDQNTESTLVIRSDLACLMKSLDQEASPWLGSTYRVSADWNLQRLGDAEIHFRQDDATIRCTAGSMTILSDRQDADGVSTLTVEPIAFSEHPNRATRWAFELG